VDVWLRSQRGRARGNYLMSAVRGTNSVTEDASGEPGQRWLPCDEAFAGAMVSQ
jgi:hypothetical protein